MKKNSITAVLFLALTTISFMVHGREQVKPKDIFDILIPQVHQESFGISKLSETERNKLSKLYLDLLKSNQLGQSSINYLLNEGWEEVTVLGTRRLKLQEYGVAQDYLIVDASVWTYILDPFTFSYLSPGRYLGKMSFVSCEIIDHDGSAVMFWTEDTQ